MSAPTCSNCGNILRLDAVFCPKCGVAVAAAGGAAVGASTSVPPGRPVRKISRKSVTIIVAIIVVGAAVGMVSYYEFRPGGPENPFKVRVTQVIWTANGAPLGTGAGFSVVAGAKASVSINLYCQPNRGFFSTSPQTCQSGSAYVNTPGFGVFQTNAPFSWSSGTSGANMAVTLRVTTPSSSYSGSLAIDLH